MACHFFPSAYRSWIFSNPQTHHFDCSFHIHGHTCKYFTSHVLLLPWFCRISVLKHVHMQEYVCTSTCECNLTLRCKDLHEMNKQAMLIAGTYSQCRSVQVQTPVLQLLAGLCIVVDTVHKLLHCGQALVRGTACVGTQVLPTPYMPRWKHTDSSKSNTHQKPHTMARAQNKELQHQLC